MTIFDVRPEAGLQRAPEGDGWVAASHAAVQTILREPGWSNDHRKATGYAQHQAGLGIPEVAGELLSKVLVFMDAPDHTRLVDSSARHSPRARWNGSARTSAS